MAIMNTEPTQQEQVVGQGSQQNIMPRQSVDMVALQRVVKAGRILMYSDKTRQHLINGLTREAAPSDIIPIEICGVMKIMLDTSKGKIPANVISPAADILCIDLSDFAKESGLMEIDAKTLLDIRTKTALGVMKVAGVLDQQQGQQQEPPQEEMQDSGPENEQEQAADQKQLQHGIMGGM